MKTLNIQQAAALLHMHPVTLREKAAQGIIPASKGGRAWVFVESTLVDWINGDYPRQRGVLQVIDGKKQQEVTQPCQFTSERIKTASQRATGKYSSNAQTVSEYNSLLGLKTKKPRKNCTINSRRKAGESQS